MQGSMLSGLSFLVSIVMIKPCSIIIPIAGGPARARNLDVQESNRLQSDFSYLFRTCRLRRLSVQYFEPLPINYCQDVDGGRVNHYENTASLANIELYLQENEPRVEQQWHSYKKTLGVQCE